MQAKNSPINHPQKSNERINAAQEGREFLAATTPEPQHSPDCTYPHDDYEFNQWKRVPMAQQDPKIRATNFEEVTKGYTLEEAKKEASRCINCKNPKCVSACPVAINIPAFIQEILKENLDEALQIISHS